MLLFLPIMLRCSAHKFHLLLCSCEGFVLRNAIKLDCFIRVDIYTSTKLILKMMIVLLELGYIDLLV